MNIVHYRAKVKYPTNCYIFGSLKSEGTWVYGEPHVNTKIPHIHENEHQKQPIDVSTLGRSTGYCDRRGELIFEGDIVEGQTRHGIKRCVVQFSHGCFHYGISERGSSTKVHPYLLNSKVLVVGNIYDNPNLIQDQAELSQSVTDYGNI